MPPRPDTVFFLSDYGTRDEFAGVVRAVLRRLAPAATVIDLTHEVPPFDVAAGARALARSIPHLGDGVVLGVVDPGVGSARRCVALRVVGERQRFFVGPDNGLLLPAAELGEWVGPLTAHIVAATPGGEVLHGDCGAGELVGALAEAGLPARGAEPRGMVALTALERGHSVTRRGWSRERCPAFRALTSR